MIGFSPAVQQLQESALAYERAASALEFVAVRSEDCIAAIFASAQSVRWESPAGQAFIALTYHHVTSARERQESVAALAARARMISGDLQEYAHLARVLAGAVESLTGAGIGTGIEAELGAGALLAGARRAGDSAADFLGFLERHGGLPRMLLAEASGSGS
ncbi:hypothetical protein [Nesterenkonia sp. Act20]|uniref:hypothetical protein n=1 Tax=Nesterenkonia sp. Act20 TaxID=1483432 RepID=UPI001C439617|nr:hypothetical protein [Nesterenkonia sp. Act20]